MGKDVLIEKWKRIPGWYYKISNHGRVKSLPRIRTGKNNSTIRQNGRILKPGTVNGYKRVCLSKANKRKSFLVHLLVLEYFGKPKPSPLHETNHKDGNKINNHISNLEWCTPSENQIHSVENGLKRRKLNKKKIILIKKLYESERYTQNELGELFGVSRSTINNIFTRRTWRRYL